MIRLLTGDEKQRSKALYSHAFPEDSETFLEYYFKIKTADNRIIADEEDGEIVSMANLNPYSVVFCGRRAELDYIIAVATHANYRRQGRMRGVLASAFDVMYREGKPFTYLKPANKDYYLPFGFGFISEVWETRPKEGSDLKKIILTADLRNDAGMGQYAAILGKDFVDELNNDFFAASMSERSPGFGEGLFDARILEFQRKWLASNADVYCDRTQEYLNGLYHMLGTDGGEIGLYFDKENRLAGVEIYWSTGESIEFLGDPEYFDRIRTGKPDKMARIIHLEEFVQVLHLKPDSLKQIETMKFRIRDEMIPENNGTFLWHLNREFSYIEKLEHEDRLEVFEVGIGDFISWAFGQKELDGGYVFEDIQRLHPAEIHEEV